MIVVHNVYDAGGFAPLQHIHFLYDLLCEREQHQSISHQQDPSFADHAAFVRKKPYREWLLIEGIPPRGLVGAVYLTHHNEIGVFITKSAQRQGYGWWAVRHLLDNYQPLPAIPSVRPGRFVAHVAPGNEPSRKLFENLGGKLIQVTYQL